MYAKFFHAMLSESVAMAPGAYEALFVGLGHNDQVMEQLAESAMRAAQRATR
jgi:glutamate-1-semialdehyde 2,1-aminomutase